MVPRAVDVGIAEHQQRLDGRAVDQVQAGLQDGDARPLRARQRPGDVEALLGQQVVEVVAGDPARQVLGIAAADLVGVAVAKGLEPGVDLALAPPSADDPLQLLLARGADGHPGAVVEQDVQLVDLVGGPPGPQAHQRVDAARVVADHPAQRVVGVRRGVRGEGQAVPLGLGAEVVQHRARLHPRQLRSGSIERTLLTCFDQSITTATLQQPPVRLVPPPRERSGAPWRRQTATVSIDVLDVPRDHDADRHLAVVRAVGRVEGPAAGVEPDLAADRPAQLGRDAPGVDEEGSLHLLAVPLGRVVVAVAMAIVLVLSSDSRSSDGVAGGVLRLNSRPRPGRDRSGRNAPPTGVERAVEEHVLDPVVVVEILQVAEVRQGAGRVDVQRRAQWAESGSDRASHRAPTRRKPVIPPQRVASAWSTSTAPASSIRRK